MKYYDNKNWISIFFEFNRSDTIKKLIIPLIVFTIFSVLVAYLELHYLEEETVISLKNISVIHSTLGFVLSLLLVFRTNSAYDRWWEGRKHWGKLVNDTRNLAITIKHLIPSERDQDYFKKCLMLFPHILKKHLAKESTSVSLDEDYDELYYQLESSHHQPIELVSKMHFHLREIEKAKKLEKEDFLMT